MFFHCSSRAMPSIGALLATGLCLSSTIISVGCQGEEQARDTQSEPLVETVAVEEETPGEPVLAGEAPADPEEVEPEADQPPSLEEVQAGGGRLTTRPSLVSVTSDLEGRLVIDRGTARYDLPLERLEIAAGYHELQVELSDGRITLPLPVSTEEGMRSASHIRATRLPPGDSPVFTLISEPVSHAELGTLSVFSNPEGELILHGYPTGVRTPLHMHLPAGSHPVQVRYDDGSFSRIDSVTVQAEYPMALTLSGLSDLTLVGRGFIGASEPSGPAPAPILDL